MAHTHQPVPAGKPALTYNQAHTRARTYRAATDSVPRLSHVCEQQSQKIELPYTQCPQIQPQNVPVTTHTMFVAIRSKNSWTDFCHDLAYPYNHILLRSYDCICLVLLSPHIINPTSVAFYYSGPETSCFVSKAFSCLMHSAKPNLVNLTEDKVSFSTALSD